SADVRRAAGTPSGFEVTTHGGRRGTGIDAVEWVTRAADLGAGEILLNSMDADGTRDGFDLELIRLVRAAVSVPVLASGGAIAAGVAPAPFLVTYSVLFLLHGTVFPVDPPDITGSRAGEALAGVVALAFLIAIVLGLAWLLSRRTRWLFLGGQLLALGVS